MNEFNTILKIRFECSSYTLVKVHITRNVIFKNKVSILLSVLFSFSLLQLNYILFPSTISKECQLKYVRPKRFSTNQPSCL